MKEVSFEMPSKLLNVRNMLVGISGTYPGLLVLILVLLTFCFALFFTLSDTCALWLEKRTNFLSLKAVPEAEFQIMSQETWVFMLFEQIQRITNKPHVNEGKWIFNIYAPYLNISCTVFPQTIIQFPGASSKFFSNTCDANITKDLNLLYSYR